MALRHTRVLAAALLVVGSAGVARAQPPCTAEQGQALIDQGGYKQAVKEFTCVIDAQPTEVDGYRGRIEAQLLLGLYSDALRDYGRVTAQVLPVHPDAEHHPRRLRRATVGRAREYCGSHGRELRALVALQLRADDTSAQPAPG